ncbi:hypothetical protein BKA63DRAFT_548030 [Paraphoma chrysanthemicola]|nr:hypothetical protein BKA63DRAFT_548030 [Paraphoma chrysanthemicola]
MHIDLSAEVSIEADDIVRTATKGKVKAVLLCVESFQTPRSMITSAIVVSARCTCYRLIKRPPSRNGTPCSSIIMHESIFSYGLSRPYPYKWFTPAVLVGGIIATAVFSFLNVAATGYEMITIETPNPNATVAEKNFFSNWPSFMAANTQPSCESKILGVSNAYYTSNTAFSYRLESIWQNMQEVPQYFGDIPYYNNALRNCKLPSVEIFFQGLDRSALQIARQQWGAELKADIECTVDIPEGSRMIKLTTTYDLNSAVERFPGRDQKRKPSLWWGESLLAWYYLKLTSDIYMATKKAAAVDVKQKTYKGYMQFFPPSAPINRTEDITSATFFRHEVPGCFFVPWSDDGIERTVQFCTPVKGLHPFKGAELWATAATMTKIFHSTVLLDLGQISPNILVDASLLQLFSKNITAIAAQQAAGDEKWGWGNNIRVQKPGLAYEPYNTTNAARWKLAAQPAGVSVTYLCQVPHLKSTSSLIVSIGIANFVLLQVLWKVFVLSVDFFMMRRRPDMASCQGCVSEANVAEGEREDDEIELLRPSSATSEFRRPHKPGAVYSPLETSA